MRRLSGELDGKLTAAVADLKHRLADAPQEIATRAASEFALDTLTAALPEMIGGSADLTGSNIGGAQQVDQAAAALVELSSACSLVYSPE